MDFNLKNHWKIVAGATAAIAVGAAGVAMASSGDGKDDLPDTINLQDRTPVVRTVEPQPTPAFDVIPQPVLGADDSPFDSGELSASNDSFNSPDAPAPPAPPAPAPIATVDDSFDSPDDAPAPPSVPDDDTFDSPDAPAPAAPPANDSFDSPDNTPAPSDDSVDSPADASFDSADNS